ncbi:tRNA dimethylallyltransferase [Aethina tumida]|uniref:tRNA dimethylallyltransferase n=1 Tax=Aethina tumida TaxID=116153 RepID=UPI0021491429|nr:tRNA dimethylallyltransferase [Aethina tumida]XP_049818316.1 tRNA dimethylallyltransferase [Aethina tumida]
MATRLPLVVILGATGTGKTKLSLEIAQKFGGEIISADSMQVYKGLDIITAKATKEEQSQAPHHLLDIIEPHECCTILEYRNKALQIIDDIFNRNKIPIVVGGTNYYIESLLWKILIDTPDKTVSNQPGILPNNEHELPSEELHKKLQCLDPAMAKRLHPNNKRKILRSLEVLYQKGKRHSELLEEQRSSEGGSLYGGGLRYDNALILWMICKKDALNKRLDDRVDKMIEEGLLDELTRFHEKYNEKHRNSSESDYTKGIFQSIGFKEFDAFLKLNEEERRSENGQKLFNEGVEYLKLVTRRYARKQNRWTLNRFLGRTDRKVPPLYALDTTDVSNWNINVTVPAFKLVQSFLDNVECDIKPLAKMSSNSKPNAEDVSYNCEVCDRVFVGQFQWQVHLKSNKHKKRLEHRNKEEKKLS